MLITQGCYISFMAIISKFVVMPAHLLSKCNLISNIYNYCRRIDDIYIYMYIYIYIYILIYSLKV